MKRPKKKIHINDKLKGAKRICELYSEGIYTIKSCCDVVGINYSTFQYWAQPKRKEVKIPSKPQRRGFVPDVHEMYTKAVADSQANFKSLLKEAVRKGLLHKVSGLEYKEVQTISKIDSNGEAVVVNVQITKKVILPDTAALIYCTTNLQ